MILSFHKHIAAVLAIAVLCLAAAPVVAVASDSFLQTAQNLPDPNAKKQSSSKKSTKTKSAASPLPHTGVSALSLALTGVLMLIAGRLLMPKMRIALSHDRFAFELERRRYLAERR